MMKGLFWIQKTAKGTGLSVGHERELGDAQDFIDVS